MAKQVFLGHIWKIGCVILTFRVSIQRLLMFAFCIKDVLMEVE